ncbi:hypothetical protein HAX54_052586 [Datura stramonium]|uniref:Uncharacterized protein n=1 Tax=Datura stramonium TaxID=4076 RepID=A0ABS8T1F5_DATST|nr:hypothetical protein [Datura stramonium]
MDRTFQEQEIELLYGEASSETAPQHDAYGEYVDNEFADFGLMVSLDGDINFQQLEEITAGASTNSWNDEPHDPYHHVGGEINIYYYRQLIEQ